MEKASGLSEIGQIAVTVSEIEPATRFYRERLGLSFLFNTDSLSFFDCNGIRLMLARRERPDAATHSSVVYFRVPDIEAGFNELVARGVRFEGKPHIVARLPDHDLWMAFFRDQDENLMALMSEVRARRD